MIIAHFGSFRLLPRLRRSHLVDHSNQPSDKGFSSFDWLGLHVMKLDREFREVAIRALKGNANDIQHQATYQERLQKEVREKVWRRTEELHQSLRAAEDRLTEECKKSNVYYGENIKLRRAFVALTGRDVGVDGPTE